MTHTLHRRGTADDLSADYVMLCIRAAGINDSGSDAKLQEFLHIAMHHDPENIGSVKMNMYSHRPEEVIANAHAVAHAVFDNQQAVTQF
ncbi:unnamed protein product [marine sediment metagenome]|uniref:Uncharacterized protein n=1 Tax=marine sediment metagenome TaxID=412755 RepID=X1LYF9_9ZZZZ